MPPHAVSLTESVGRLLEESQIPPRSHAVRPTRCGLRDASARFDDLWGAAGVARERRVSLGSVGRARWTRRLAGRGVSDPANTAARALRLSGAFEIGAATNPAVRGRRMCCSENPLVRRLWARAPAHPVRRARWSTRGLSLLSREIPDVVTHEVSCDDDLRETESRKFWPRLITGPQGLWCSLALWTEVRCPVLLCAGTCIVPSLARVLRHLAAPCCTLLHGAAPCRTALHRFALRCVAVGFALFSRYGRHLISLRGAAALSLESAPPSNPGSQYSDYHFTFVFDLRRPGLQRTAPPLPPALSSWPLPLRAARFVPPLGAAAALSCATPIKDAAARRPSSSASPRSAHAPRQLVGIPRAWGGTFAAVAPS